MRPKPEDSKGKCDSTLTIDVYQGVGIEQVATMSNAVGYGASFATDRCSVTVKEDWFCGAPP